MSVGGAKSGKAKTVRYATQEKSEEIIEINSQTEENCAAKLEENCGLVTPKRGGARRQSVGHTPPAKPQNKQTRRKMQEYIKIANAVRKYRTYTVISRVSATPL